jgi:hypothetical protein
MRRIRQRGEDGCGIACVAMVADITYACAKERMPGQEVNGTSSSQLRAALKSCGFKTRRLKPIRGLDYKSFKFNAVLQGFLEGDHELHLVVWDSKRKRILDPYEPSMEFRCTSFVQILG